MYVLVTAQACTKYHSMHRRVFIGQGGGKGKEKGMTQKEQQATLAAFRTGEFNVMIATCIAEEGLDIPQVS